MRRQLIWATFLVLVGVVAATAQTVGRIIGQAQDASGSAVPGVSVTVTSPQLQGSLSTATDGGGTFRFLSIPPGRYKIRAELAGFKTVEQTNVQVGLDRTVSVAFKMEVAPVAETVTVEGSAVVDVTSTTTGVNVTPELFNRLAVPRNIYGIARVAPGTQDDGVGPTFYGSSGAENQYIIEGLNTTGVEVGRQGKNLNFDFVQEVEIKTGGLPAEYGRMTGGVINVLTKSGGNDFHGSAFGFFEGKGLQSKNSTASLRPQTTTTVADIDQKWDFGGELGGYLVKDKVWFFGAYNRTGETDNTTVTRPLTAPGAPAQGSVVPLDITSNRFAGKLTWRLSENHTFTATTFGDPGKREGNVFAIAGPPSTFSGTRNTGNTDLVGRYDGALSSSFLVRAMVGRHREKSTVGGAGRDIPQARDSTVVPTARSGGFGFFQDQDFTRDVYKLDLTKFFGGHEFRLGGDFENVKGVTSNFYTGGDLVEKFRDKTTGVIYYRHRFYINDRTSGFVRANPSTWQPALPLTSSPNTHNLSAFLQDNWKVGQGFSLNLGVRWERQELSDRDGKTTIDLSKNWAPRVGFVWDVANNGKSKVYANYGRFFESIPMDIQFRSFGGELLGFQYNFDPTPKAYTPNPAAPRKSSVLGSSVEPVDPNLKGQYISEYLVGFEYEVAKNLAVGVKGSYRTLGRVVEDFLIPSKGDYFIANPGVGLGKDLAFYPDGANTAPSPKAARKNWSVELTARKRYSDNWQLLASYVFSKLDGNYDGTFQNSTGQLDPNINSAFDYADFLVNANGPLSIDVKHQLKLDGSYQFKGALDGLNVGLSTHWYSGAPKNAYGYSFAYANWEYYLAPRGSLGRHPSDYETSVHVSYPIKLGNKSSFNVIADVFNLFNRQAITEFDQRYNLSQDGACAGVPEALCNGDGGLKNVAGTVNPLGSIPNPLASATNPDYLKKGVAFTGQRSVRVGVRLTF
jgi:outer membrane receptor for Fe3+-dicitrate